MKKLSYIILSLLFYTTFLSLALNAANILVSWNPNSEADLAGYNVYYGTASGQYGEAISTTETSQLLTLTPSEGTTYYFAVTAYDTSGNESGYSEEVSLFIPDPIAPAPPTGIQAIIQAVIGWFRGLFGLSAKIV